MNNTETIKTISLRELRKQGGWKTISELRQNQNNYYFITFLNDKGRASNVLFGKKTSEIVDGAYKVGDDITEFLGDCDMVQTKNAQGELRFKISKNISSYSSDAAIESIFGSKSGEINNFDLEAFKKSYFSEAAVQDNTAIQA